MNAVKKAVRGHSPIYHVDRFGYSHFPSGCQDVLFRRDRCVPLSRGNVYNAFSANYEEDKDTASSSSRSIH